MSGPSLPSDATGRCPHCFEEHPTSYTHCPNTGKSLSVGSALIGRIIAGRYRVVGQLGEGGMGEVFVAEHLLIGRKVAIKRLHPELASDERAVQRFQREARAAAATGHEHIVEVLDLGYADDNAPYLVMEYLRGQPLSELLKREGRLSPSRTCTLLVQVLAALQAVHQQEIVHRDLKPDNVFVTRRPGVGEFVKVLDFGISKMKEENGEALQLTRTGMMMGTPFYMSPEQARGVREVDHRVDLYAVGVMLYECLTGRLPFSSDNYHALLQQILRTEPRRPSEFAPSIEPGLDAVVMRSLGKDPALRYATAADFSAALLPFAAAPITGPSALPAAANLPIRPTPEDVRAPTPPRREPVETGLESVPVERSEGRASFRPRAPEVRMGRQTPRYFFAASDDWQPERARAGAVRPPLAVSLLGRDVAEAERAPADTRVALRPEPLPLPSVAPTVARSEAAVRGSWFVGALEYIQAIGGPGKVEEVGKRMPPAAAERIGGVILPMAWLPLATFESLLLALGEGDGGTHSVGRAIAERELTTTHRLFVQTATPQSALDRFPHLFRLYHLRGTALIEESEAAGGGVRITLDVGSPEPLHHVQVVSAFLQRFLEICGARDVRTHILSCRGRGEERTVVSCRFR